MKRILAGIVSILVLASCASGAGGASSPTAAPRPVTSVEDAAARVAEVYPALAAVGPADPNMIGGCCSWTGSETADGYTVRFEVGWGDCPSGCINRHAWTFSVGHDGAVALTVEQGPPVPSGVPGAGSGSGGGGGVVPGGTGIQGHVLAGPTCPVVRPNDPACNDRPVAGATIVVVTADGREAGRTTSAADGAYGLSLPPGPYTVEPQPVEGMMGGAAPVAVTVGDGITTVDVSYDTGIR